MANANVVEPKLLESAIRTGCNRAIAAEPNLTKWDMIMGDGDCGEAVRDVCNGMFVDDMLVRPDG